MKKRVFALAVCLLMALATLAACGGGSASSGGSSTPAADASLEDIKAKGELVIGLDDSFAPMGFREPDGTLVGFDIDLGRAVCEELGVEATFQPISWDAKEMELDSGNIDCIWNGFSVTPEREEAMSMSQPYLKNRMIVMTNTGITIADKEDMANYNIGIQAGSAALSQVEKDDVYEDIKDKITEFETYDLALLDMDAGRIDCVVIDEVLGNYKNAQRTEKLGVADFDFGDDYFAIGFRKGDVALTEAVNDILNTLNENGKAAEISEEWFGQDVVLRK